MDSWKQVSEVAMSQIEGWIKSFGAMLPNLVVALVVVLAFIFIASVMRKILQRFLPRVSNNSSVNSLLATVGYALFIAIGVFVALGVLQLDKTVTSLLAGAGVIGIALGFAFQEIASNFIAGVIIAFVRPFKVGDIVEIETYLGVIQRIDIRTTSLMTFDQIEVAVPNKEMFTKVIKNYTTTPKRRLELKCGVSYGEDLRKVLEVAKRALDEVAHRTDDPVEVYFQEFGGSSINFSAFIWVVYPGDANFFKAQNDAVIRLKEAFDREGIVIPYPIRTLDFGIKGGETLKDQLSLSKSLKDL